ncbi:hypothetical protein [Reinekea sp. G2M2-21]|uniref:hypothetical protein n=1 Tax=Reinekea sp. G2M2-21 TaxID=2788942 RepID=UPI0018AC0EBE|nr:hypothetical protein [Reinekea sp. G2M2-21]
MIKRILKYISYLGVLASFCMFGYGNFGPFYKTELLKAPFSFSTVNPQEFKFTPQISDEYMIEVHLERNLPENQMDEILGNYVKRDSDSLIFVEWELKQGGEVLARGSNKEFGYSPIFGGGYYGLVIGTVSLTKGELYTLLLGFDEPHPEWEETKPILKVGLHPAKLEYLIGYLLFGVLLFLLFIPFAGYFVYRGFRDHLE